MFRVRLALTALAAAVVLPAMVRAQQQPPAPGDEQQLIAVLQKADSPAFERAKACQTLAVIGTKRCVPVLAGLLSDEQLAHYARFGLEPIPDPSVDVALRAAMGKLHGKLLAGVIGSIGIRRDAKAVDALKEHLGHGDRDVAAAAAAALGRIATPESVQTLEQALRGAEDLRPAVGDACLTACDMLMAAGKRDDAAGLYDAVFKAPMPKFIKIAAAHGAIRARGAAGVPLLIEYLRSEDKDLFGVALRVARELPAAEVTGALVAELGKLKPAPEERVAKVVVIVKAEYGANDKWADVTDRLAAAIHNNTLSITAGNDLAGDPAPGVVKRLRVTYRLGDKESTVEVPEKEVFEVAGDRMTEHPRHVALISLLGDVGDQNALPVVLEAAKSGAWDVRLAAFRVLARLGDARAVPMLLETAIGGQGELAETARGRLAGLKGQAVDDGVAAAYASSKGRARVILTDLVGQRGIRSLVPALLKDADSQDEQTRHAAIGALGLTVGLDNLDALVARLIEPKSPQDAGPVRDALQKACLRMPDRDAAAAKFLARVPQAPVETKGVLLELAGTVGGAKALEGVAAAARDPSEELQDAATRVLGEWMSADAAPVLLDLAKTAGNNKFKVRAMRGYIRIIRQLDLPADQKLAMAKTALGAAWRDEEKRLVLESVTRIPSPESLALAVSHLDDTALKDQAGLSAVMIGEKIVQRQPAAVAEAMKRVLEATKNKDLTRRARTLVDRAGGKSPEK
jgi:HEAT repeat protein